MILISFLTLFLSMSNSYTAEMITLDAKCGKIKICAYSGYQNGKIFCNPMPNGQCPAKDSCENNLALRLKKIDSVESKIYSIQGHFDLLELLRKFSSSKGNLNSLEEINKLRLHLGNEKYAVLKKYFEGGGKLRASQVKSIDQTAIILSKVKNKEQLNLKETKYFSSQLEKSLELISKDEPIYKSVTEYLKLPLAKQRVEFSNQINSRLPATAAMVVAVATVRVVETLVKQATGGGGDRFTDKINFEINENDFDLP